MRIQHDKATGSRISGSRQQKNKIRCGIFINFCLSSLIFEVKKSEIYYSESRSTTSEERAYPRIVKIVQRNGERKPNNNYNCCIKPIPTLENCQMPILSLSGASLLEKQSSTNDEIV